MLAVEAQGLTRKFGGFTAVDNVSFHVEKGEIFGYLGANGAGKSTTIRMLTGLLRPTGGTCRVAGHDVAHDPDAVKASIGYMSQKFSLYLDLAVRDNLLFFGGAYGMSGRALTLRAGALLELVGLADRPREITGDLPGGLRQRLALACALLHEPQIVFLDEPTAGVDPLARRAFWKLIRDLSRAGTTVFVTTHYLDEAEYCARVGLMVDGRLSALDTPKGLKKTWVQDQVLVVHGPDLLPLFAKLRALDFVRSVTAFGSGLHVRVDPKKDGQGLLRHALSTLGAKEFAVEESEPSLEDVFLEVVGKTSAKKTETPTC